MVSVRQAYRYLLWRERTAAHIAFGEGRARLGEAGWGVVELHDDQRQGELPMAPGRLAIAPDTSADLAPGKIGRAPPHQLALLDIESAQPAHHFIGAIVAEDVVAGRLERVLPQWQGSPVPVYVITETRLLPAKTQRFIEFLRERLSAP